MRLVAAGWCASRTATCCSSWSGRTAASTTASVSCGGGMSAEGHAGGCRPQAESPPAQLSHRHVAQSRHKAGPGLLIDTSHCRPGHARPRPVPALPPQPRRCCWRHSGTACSRTLGTMAWAPRWLRCRVRARVGKGRAWLPSCCRAGRVTAGSTAPGPRAVLAPPPPLHTPLPLHPPPTPAVKLYNPVSNLCVVRCSRDEYRRVRDAAGGRVEAGSDGQGHVADAGVSFF